MGSADRATSHALAFLEALRQAPHGFGFFAALRRMESLFPEKPRIGESSRLRDDPVRFSQIPSLAFAASTLAAFDRGQAGRPPRLAVNFLGLFGPNGPLPLHLTEYAYDRLHHHDDPTFVRFLDIFHHRVLALFYRAWARAQPCVNFDRPSADRFALFVGSLFGLGSEPLRHRDAVPDLAKLYNAGPLGRQTRSAEDIQGVIGDFFRLPVQLIEFTGEWLSIPPELRWRLGESPRTGALGATVTLGARVWHCQHKFRVRLGPLGLGDYQRFLPGGQSLQRLVAWVGNLVGDELAWDLNLVLKKDEVPPLELGRQGRLGWTTWLIGRPLERDADQLVLNPLAR